MLGLVLEWRTSRDQSWYAGAAVSASSRPVDVLFVGSSRTAAAIDTDAFSRESKRQSGEALHVINLGLGYSTLREHYLGLRNLLGGDRPAFDGCTVFIEVSAGLPQLSTIDDPWVHSDRPEMIAPLLTTGDLPDLWLSRTVTEDKIQATVGYLLRGSNFWPVRKVRGVKLIRATETALRLMLVRVGLSDVQNDRTGLTARGGVRTDAHALESVRRRVLNIYTRQANTQSVVDTWETQSVVDVIRLIRSLGGRPVLLEVPMASQLTDLFQTQAAQVNRQDFRRYMATLGVPLIHSVYTPRDEAFPDWLHLSASDSRKFTVGVWEACAAGDDNPGPVKTTAPARP